MASLKSGAPSLFLRYNLGQNKASGYWKRLLEEQRLPFKRMNFSRPVDKVVFSILLRVMRWIASNSCSIKSISGLQGVEHPLKQKRKAP